ncbi:hypothetical protein HELRODRAFT_182830 [Helobdella robusta]|uniref:Major facilitator superfamily (MFS) profile domain-containing protein n=1 Tax=Helobdella robusta TaxID=6412 RepID=T1FIT7_HELRO|nr:hypothetical protein HELRODRAFT_182830 [Helobdella robusta]ESN90133.1 hypothetical protein HELRODRAFT_182830 [Helobdella robusta]
MGSSYVLFGLLYKDLIQEFQSSSAAVGWIGSLFVGCGNIMGIVFGLVVERKGSRLVCMLGSLICSAGFFLSFFASSLFHLYLTYGLMAGIGMSMIVTPCVVNVMIYFDEKRPLAGALMSFGYSIGSVLVGPVMRYIFELVSWRGSLVLFSCLTLQMTPASYFAFRPHFKFNKLNENAKSNLKNPIVSTNSDNDNESEINKTKNCTTIVNFDELNDIKQLTEKHLKTASLVNLASMTNDTNLTLDARRSTSVADDKFSDENCVGKESFAEQSVVPPGATQPLQYNFHELCDASSTDDRENIQTETFGQLLCDAPLVCYLLSVLFMYTGIQVYMNHTPSRGCVLGVDRTLVNYLPVTYNGVSGFMKIVSGFISNRPNINRLLLYSTAVLGVGVALMFTPFFITFQTMLLQGVLCGVFAGFLFSLFVTLVVDLKGRSNVTKTTPMVNFSFGSAGLIGTSLAGDYNSTFLITSSLVLLASFLSFLSLFIHAKKSKVLEAIQEL